MSFNFSQDAKLMKLSRAHLLAKDEDKESTLDEEEENSELGPNAHMSLLDQHSKLKQEAQGLNQGISFTCTHTTHLIFILFSLQYQYVIHLEEVSIHSH